MAARLAQKLRRIPVWGLPWQEMTPQETDYGGRDPRKRAKAGDENRIAADLENKINAMLLEQKEPIKEYLYFDIARATGYDLKLVERLGFSIDGGHNGFTAWRHDLTYEQALASH